MNTDKQRYETMVKYFFGKRTDKDDAFVACKCKDDFDRLLDTLINQQAKVLTFTYKNHKGDVSVRSVTQVNMFYGSSGYHHKDQWLLRAFDIDKNALRTFAMKDILKIG